MWGNDIQLSWQLFKQERQQSHQRFLRWTQTVLVVFVLTLSLSSDNIQRYLTQNLQNLLGADAVLSHRQALSRAQYQSLSEMSDRMSVTQQVTASLNYNDQWQQVWLKGVDQNYPLQGQLRTTEQPLTGAGSVVGEGTDAGPQVGEIWLDGRLVNTLQVPLGAQLQLGQHTFVFSRILLHEPDRLMEGHSVQMRAMVSAQDFQRLEFAEDIVQTRYLLAASNANVQALLAWQREVLPAADIYHKQGSHPLALFWQRTENVLGLASVILFFMAAIAIEQLSHVQIRKQRFFSAVCMSVGASKGRGIRISMLKWLWSIALLIPSASAIATLCHYGLIQWLSDTFNGLSWQFQPATYLSSLALVFAVFLLFQLPVWFATWRHSVANLISGNGTERGMGLTKFAGMAVLSVIAIVYSDNWLLTAMIIGTIAICITFIVVFSWTGLSFAEKLSQRFSGLLPFSLYMMKQRLVNKSTQILGVGLCAFLLLFTLMLMKDLGDMTAAHQREHNGNLLVSQASSEQMDYMQTWSNEHGIDIRQVKPFVYAKLLRINQQTIEEFQPTPSDSMATMSRSIRMHWSADVPSNNRVIAGQWWHPQTENWQQVSVEEEVMTDLGLTIGDQLEFYISGNTATFTIVASHVYRSGGGSITFWVQMPPAARAHLDSAEFAMASLELTQDDWPLLGELWQKFPTLRMVSLQEMTKRFDDMLNMVTQIISGFSFLIILLAGIVILATVNAQERKEMKKNSVVMSFGFDRRMCLKLNIVEWTVTGGLAAFGAIAGTYVAGLLIYQSQFSLVYQPNWWWLLSTLCLIMSAVVGLGVYASKRSLNASIRDLLAEN